MSSSSFDSLAELQARAAQADTLVDTLAARVASYRTLVESEAISKLKVENAQLLKQVADAKAALVAAEVAHGKPQIALPGGKAPAVAAPTAAVAVPVAPVTAATKKVEPAAATAAAAAAPKAEKKKEAKAAAPAPAAAGGDDDAPTVGRVLLKVGLITKAEKHPDADALYLETVECGEDRPRTVISGLAGKVPLEEMQNRLVVLCANLKPVKMRGILSEAMVMCASSETKVEVLDPPAGAVPGDIVQVEGFIGVPDEQLNPKKKIFEAVQPDFLTTEDCVATYKGVPWSIKGKPGVIKAQTMKLAHIK